MNPENGVSRIDPEKQRARSPRKRRRRQMCWPGMGPAAVIILALAMVMVTAGRALQPSKAESSPAAIKSMAAEDFTPEPVEHEDRDTEPVVSVEPEHEGQEGTGEGDDPMLDEQIEATLEAEGYFRDDVPLSYELQDQLHTACEESGVPYALALAIIEKETRFRNLVGDDGASQGYMQIQRKWHYDRMERLGVTDLMDPFGNFRVGCDYLAELLGTYCSVDIAVTVYNMGHSPGYVTRYGRDVMANYEKWKELLGDD